MFLGKEVRVQLKGQAKDAYIELKSRQDKDSETLLKSIHRIFEILKKNPQFGDPVKKQLIPRIFLDLGVQNLYRTELSNYWRMLYTLEGNRVEIFCFTLSITDHDEYNKLFGYKKL